MHEELFIERRPVSGEARTGQIEADSSTIRIPLMREQLHTEKRAVVEEEVIVGKRPVQEQQTVTADLAREHLDINKSAGLDQRSGGSILGDSRTTGPLAGQGNFSQQTAAAGSGFVQQGATGLPQTSHSSALPGQSGISAQKAPQY